MRVKNAYLFGELNILRSLRKYGSYYSSFLKCHGAIKGITYLNILFIHEGNLAMLPTILFKMLLLSQYL